MRRATKIIEKKKIEEKKLKQTLNDERIYHDRSKREKNP